LEGREEIAAGGRPAFGRGEGIRVDLAGMQEVGEGVDDRNRTGGRQPFDFRVVEGSHDQAVHKAG